jgi:hypothetical protein
MLTPDAPITVTPPTCAECARPCVCEHAFVGDASSPYALFQRSVDRRNLVSATSAAYALPELSLADAAALVLLAAEKDPDGMFPRAAARWAARYILEVPRVDIDEAVLLIAALSGLPQEDPHAPLLALVAICHRRGLEKVEAAFTRGIWPSAPNADKSKLKA